MSEFDFQMERAAARTESGDFDRAMGAYEEISAAADLPCKIEALCKMVELDLELGKFSSAEARLSELAKLLAEDRAQLDSTQVSRAHADWLATRLALLTAEFERAAELQARVCTDLARLGESCNRSLRALRAEVYTELANQATDHGEFAQAQSQLDEARAICKGDPKLNVTLLDVLLHQINLDVSRMRPGDGQSLRELMALINRALEMAEQSRSMKHKILLAAAQVQLQCSADNGLPEVERVLAIAKSFPNLRLAAYVELMLGDYLMRGRNWRVTGVLLHDAFPKNTFAWGLAMHRKSEYLLRLGELSAAHDYAKLALDGAKHTGNSRLCGIALRGLAITAHLQRNSKEAVDYIEAAVPMAERYGSLMSCVKTYHWAATITGKQKYVRGTEKLRLAVR
jgi:tetratricopeptide (TPR) repeat protein